MQTILKIKTQKGVFLPLSAVIALGLFTMLFLLVGYSGRVKMAQSELRAKLDIACGDISQYLSYVEKENIFKARVQNLLIKGSLRFIDLEKAVLYLPTMPGTNKTDITYKIGDTVIVIKRTVSGAEGYPVDFWSDTEENSKNAGNTVGCEFYGKARTGFISPYFLNLLNDENGENNDTIRLKSVWWSPVRSASQSGTAIANLPGLTIAVGTEMFTTNFDKRFRFKIDLTPGTLLDPVNPVKNADDRGFYEDKSESKNFPQIGSSTPVLRDFTEPDKNDAVIGPGSRRINTATQAFDVNFEFKNWLPDDPPPGPDLVITDAAFGSENMPSERDGLLTACMNPVILARNTFLSTITELAARHGQLRKMTEILHMNPMHRHPDFYPLMSDGSRDYISNFPAKIVEFGQDLMQKNYQLPYVFYHTGESGNEFPPIPLDANDTSPVGSYQWFRNLNGPGGTQLSGWLNPFDKIGNSVAWVANPNVPNGLRREHQLIAAQLRYCYNLYSPGGIGRFALHRNLIADSDDFEPPIYSTGWGNQRTRAIDQTYWDQRCDNRPNVCNNPTEAQKDLLSAPQIVSILGSTQRCPMSYIRAGTNDYLSGINPNNTSNLCPLTYPPSYAGVTWHTGQVPNSSQSLELTPDIIGTLRYVSQLTSSNSLDQTGKALKPPGIFPLANAPLSTTRSSPFAIDSASYKISNIYSAAENGNSHLVLVFHQPVINQDVRDQIKSLVTKLVAGNSEKRFLRYISVFYFPTTYFDHNQIIDLRAAFAIDPEEMDSILPEFSDASIFASSDPKGFTSPIVLYNFSPYDDELGKKCGGPGSSGVDSFGGIAGKSQSEVFRDYWHCLLTDSSNNIANEAREIFRLRLLRNELKF